LLSPEVLSCDDLLGIDELSLSDINLILERTKIFSEINQRDLKKVPFLRGQTVFNLFFENSTRTRVSFELAAKRLSADTVNFSASSSSLSKGETLVDTVKTIEAMSPAFIVIRHGSSGVPYLIKKHTDAIIINAGDGIREHPTQALLDAYTLMEKLGRKISDGLRNIKIAIVGDIKHSRVARSNMIIMKKLGAEVFVVAPKSMIPKEIEGAYGVSVISFLDDLCDVNIDAVMLLRIQKERMKGNLMSTQREYSKFYGMTKDRYENNFKNKIIMHPGPINRSVEIASEVADNNNSLILNQAKNGIAVRMAVMYSLAAKRMQKGSD